MKLCTACGVVASRPLAQVADIELDAGTVAAIVRALASAPRPIAIDRARIERQIRELALEHAAGRLENDVYLERLRGPREARESLERTTTEGISAERAVAWLETLSATWSEADVPRRRRRCCTPSTNGSWSQGGRSRPAG